MSRSELHVVTGAFGYLGKHIAQLLLARGERVRTLTGHPERPSPVREQVRGGCGPSRAQPREVTPQPLEVCPFHFEDPRALAASLRGASVVYNTYWVRFERGPITFERAIANSRTLIRATAEAGVPRFVHISITNPSEDSPLPYFRGKALVERAVIESGLSYAILRPTVLFGEGDVLINNIAWLLRRLPVFGVFGPGDYRLQPAHVADVAALAVELAGSAEAVVVDAAGPETYTFAELVRLVRRHVRSRAAIGHVSPSLALTAGWLVGWLLRDVVITRDEIAGLMADLLVSGQPPRCTTRFSEWLEAHGDELGREYASELRRHYRSE